MKKNIILIVVFAFFLILFIVLAGIAYKTVKAHSDCEKCMQNDLEFAENNSEKIFSIDKITYFSSSDAKIETNPNSSFIISDLYQYTDIAIFLNPNSEEFTAKNTLKSVVLNNIEFSLKPSLGTPALYYKNINDFTTSKFSAENLISDTITFDTTSENTINYSKPILYNNCANPITLCYVNSKLLEDSYTLQNAVSNISHNGSLLKNCKVTLNSIACKLSFVITITNNLDETYSCPITLDIPLSTEQSTIYDGGLTINEPTDYIFIRK